MPCSITGKSQHSNAMQKVQRGDGLRLFQMVRTMRSAVISGDTQPYNLIFPLILRLS